jgi:hypothetical protein
MRRVPTQTAKIEPNKDVLEYAKRLFREHDPDMEPEEYVKQMVVDSTQLKVDLEDSDWKP